MAAALASIFVSNPGKLMECCGPTSRPACRQLLQLPYNRIAYTIFVLDFVESGCD